MSTRQKLAIDGGKPVKTTPFGTGIRYGEEERDQVAEVFKNNHLSYWSKYKVSEFCAVVRQYFGIEYCAGGSSGSAAVHAAVAALEIEPGYEVITTPITDMGTLIGILYQNLIPVFADVDPYTYNLTAATIEKVITPRTRAIVVVHLAGNPCDMAPIMALAKRKNLPVIEDCAQAYGALYHGKKAGTFGAVGAFSLNESKHLSCGDGGFAITGDGELYGRIHNYFDKYYDRLDRGDRLSHLAPCYRLSELQYAVAIAQFGKLDAILSRRRELAAMLQRELAGIPGLHRPEIVSGAESSWWFYMFRLTAGAFRGDGPAFANALQHEGIPALAGYIPQPVYREKLFADKSFFPGNVWPAEIISGKTYAYRPGLCPVAEEVLNTAIRLPVSEFFSPQDMEETVIAIRKVVAHRQN